jgi:hypothetical protein
MRAALISIPKSGTNLVVALLNEACPDAPLIDLMYPEPMVNGQSPREYSMRSMVHARRVLETTGGRALFHSHMVFTDYLQTTLWEFGIPPIFLIRDPRAVAVSFVDYVLKETDHPAHTYFRTQLPNMASRLAVTIRGTDPEDTSLPFVPSIKTAWTRYVRWLRQPEVLVLRYEGLVGPEFGGSSERRQANVQRLLEHVGLPADDAAVTRVIESGARPDHSVTFFKGGIHRWRESFTPELHDLFRAEAGEILQWYRYDA